MKTGAEWDLVVRAYNHFGITALLDVRLTSSGFVYNNGVVALGSESTPWMALHDLAHYIVAMKNEPGREMEPNFALGEHPIVDEPGHHDQNVTTGESTSEEGEASALHVVLANILFGFEKADAVALDLSVRWDGESVQPSRGYDFEVEDFDLTWTEIVKGN